MELRSHATKLAVMALATGLSLMVWSPTPAHAAPEPELGRALASDAAVAGQASPAASATRVGASATTPAAQAIARLNSYRSMFGVAAVTENPAWSADAGKHSSYMANNNVVTHSEDAAQPFYTPEGNTSGLNSQVAIGYSTPTQFVDAWAASPFHLITMLSSKLTTTGYGQVTAKGTTAATLNVLQGRTAPEATTGWPRTWPRGTTSILQLSDGASPDPVVGCGAPTGAWFGTATLVDFGPGVNVASATATLYEDGTPLPVCVRTAANYGDATARQLMAGKALVIPKRPLALNKGYYGTVTSNTGVTADLRFDTGNPASGVFGDHNGDRLADVLAVRATGELYWYQTIGGPAFAPGMVVGRGWNGFTWMATVPDLNGDGRTELVGRDANGNLWLYQGLGRGAWGPATRVGTGFGAMQNLTVIRDITGDGLPELLGQAADGRLLRYSFTTVTAGLSNTAAIGQNWGGMSQLFSPGDFSGDGSPDLLAVRKDGLLWSYSFSNGRFATSRSVGQGWTPRDRTWSPGDMDGDGKQDLLAVRNGSQLWFYKNLGTRWAPGRQVGQGWDAMRLLT